jgi:hypothetical protein
MPESIQPTTITDLACKQRLVRSGGYCTLHNYPAACTTSKAIGQELAGRQPHQSNVITPLQQQRLSCFLCSKTTGMMVFGILNKAQVIGVVVKKAKGKFYCVQTSPKALPEAMHVFYGQSMRFDSG